jgi:hypothetical protein
MSEIFLSYKREDEPKAGRLVAALEAEGLQVWWDRGLPGGEEWRANIERALNQAKCVIVLWTQASVGQEEGRFVRDEASRAYGRHILVPVLIERVSPPLGFGEVQAIDLVHWRGSRNDPFFKDLVAAVRAKLEGRDVPPAKGPAVRLYRRLRAGAGVTAIVAAVAGFGMNALGVQNQLCTVPVGQPFISDTCGTFGLGGRPSGRERIDMEQAQGNCDALRAIASNPNHHFNQDAAAVLDAAVPIRATEFTPAPREARNYLRTAERPHATEAAAREDALARARTDAAEVTCAPRQFERLDGVDLDMDRSRPDCRPDPRGGYVCGLDYVAQCRISEQALVERCQ